MKFKDALTKFKTDGKIVNPEFDKAIETAPEWEFPDKALEAFEAVFMTPDRAKTDKTVHSKLLREILDPVDKEIQPLIAFIDTIDKFKASEIDKMTSTYDKIKAIQAAVPALVEKVKKTADTDDDTKKKLKTLSESNTELLDRIEKMNTEFSNKEKFFETEAEKKINGFRLNQELEKMANTLKFGKAYEPEPARKKITKVTLDELRLKHNLQLVDKDGQTQIQVLDKEGKPLFKNNSNTAVTINQLLEEEFKDFIKTNNSGDDDDEPEGSDNSKGRDTKRFQVSDDKNKVRTGHRTTVTKSL